jgi:hypothetical protein
VVLVAGVLSLPPPTLRTSGIHLLGQRRREALDVVATNPGSAQISSASSNTLSVPTLAMMAPVTPW